MMRNLIKFLLLAQVASNSGKGIFSPKQNSQKAVGAGYELKDTYIAQAIGEAKRLKGQVRVSKSWDTDLWMWVVYFDFKSGEQVSFHSYKEWKKLPETGEWDRTNSREICFSLARKFNLPHY